MKFIDGVTYLSESTWAMAWWVALIIALVGGFITFFAFYHTNNKDIKGGIIFALIISTILFCTIYFPNCTPETIYSVLIDDTVSWQEFNEHYEMIGQDGQIIKIKVKEY